MESHEVLREVYDTSSPKHIAAQLGLSLSLIYKWAEPAVDAGSGTANPLDRIDALMRATNDQRLVQWVCERAGGFFIRNPKSESPSPANLVPATNQIVQEFADLLAVIASAAHDNQVSPSEAQSIRTRWEDLKTVTESFVRCCEEGNFRPIKRDPPAPRRSV